MEAGAVGQCEGGKRRKERRRIGADTIPSVCLIRDQEVDPARGFDRPLSSLSYCIMPVSRRVPQLLCTALCLRCFAMNMIEREKEERPVR